MDSWVGFDVCVRVISIPEPGRMCRELAVSPLPQTTAPLLFSDPCECFGPHFCHIAVDSFLFVSRVPRRLIVPCSSLSGPLDSECVLLAVGGIKLVNIFHSSGVTTYEIERRDAHVIAELFSPVL